VLIRAAASLAVQLDDGCYVVNATPDIADHIEACAWLPARESNHDPEGLRYFRVRVSQSRQDSSQALALVLEWARTRTDQERAITALGYKCDVLWALLDATVAPDGRVLPCPAAYDLPLELPNARDHSIGWIWEHSPAFNAYRGTGWMREPCASCPRKELDFGGCRCQAYALTGDAGRTDPACGLSPDHRLLDEPAGGGTWTFRRPAPSAGGADRSAL
jgi:pyrroloquinoline quinone biosynthesis protein E